MSLTEPRSGPCSPWIAASDVLQLPGCGGLASTDAAEIASAVSNLLYKFSGQQFSGVCGPVTVRPVSRPPDADTRGQAALWSSTNYLGSWGICSAYGNAAQGAASHYTCTLPPEIELGAYPITEVTQVLIDGVEIPGPYDPVANPLGEWALQDYRTLVRIRPTTSFNPTERFGWPTCQTLDTPDNVEGSFSVTYMYGQPVPDDGILGAKALAKELALQWLGQPNQLPSRATSISRQSVSAVVLDIIDYVAQGRTGIFLTDLFIKSSNPTGSTKPSLVWSPDMGRARRSSYGTAGPAT